MTLMSAVLAAPNAFSAAGKHPIPAMAHHGEQPKQVGGTGSTTTSSRTPLGAAGASSLPAPTPTQRVSSDSTRNEPVVVIGLLLGGALLIGIVAAVSRTRLRDDP